MALSPSLRHRWLHLAAGAASHCTNCTASRGSRNMVIPPTGVMLGGYPSEQDDDDDDPILKFSSSLWAPPDDNRDPDELPYARGVPIEAMFVPPGSIYTPAFAFLMSTLLILTSGLIVGVCVWLLQIHRENNAMRSPRRRRKNLNSNKTGQQDQKAKPSGVVKTKESLTRPREQQESLTPLESCFFVPSVPTDPEKRRAFFSDNLKAISEKIMEGLQKRIGNMSASEMQVWYDMYERKRQTAVSKEEKQEGKPEKQHEEGKGLENGEEKMPREHTNTDTDTELLRC